MNKSAIAKAIREARLAANLTQATVAAKTGLTTDCFAKLERGERMSASALLPVLHVLNIPKSIIEPHLDLPQTT